ncbi:hypothetical protein D3C71_2210460 [compost metagenome]
MRILTRNLLGAGNADLGQHVHRALPGLPLADLQMMPGRLRNLLADFEDGIE